MDEDKTIHLRTYSKIWKIEKRLEHLNGIKTNSIPLEHALYFLMCAAFEGLLLIAIPPLRKTNIIILLGIPYGLSTFFKKVKLDGKNPVKYFGSLIEYALEPKSYIRFRPYREGKLIRFNDMIGYRITEKQGR